MANPNIPSIELIPNQPFVFQPANPNCLGNDNTAYCVLVNECDQIQIQEKLVFNTTCFENLLCSEFTGTELVTDGDFSEGDTHWNEAGNNWVISSGVACYTVKDGNGVLYQTISGLSEGTTYRLQFTVSNYEAGNLGATLWDTLAPPVSANGTYVQYITIGAGHINETLLFDEDISWGGCVDDISLTVIGCWDNPEADDWLLSSATACHVIGSVVSLTSTITIPASATDCTFELIITVTSVTTGTLTPAIGLDTFSPITANGVYSLYVNSQGGADLTFTPSTDFDGCISIPELRQMCEYPKLAIFDLDNNFIIDLSLDGGVSIGVEGKHITWTFKLCQLEGIIVFGCYKFKLYDPCNNCFPNENELDNETFASDLSGWSEGGDWVWDAANGGEAKITASTGFVEQNIGVTKLRCVQYEILSVTGTLHLYIANSGTGLEVTTLNITSAGFYSLCGTGDTIGFSALNSSGEVGAVHAIPIDDCNDCSKYCFQVESNCFNWKEEHECTKLFIAYCEENSLGFNFGSTVYVGTGFKLQERFRVINFNPSRNKDRNVQLDSGGSKKLVFAQNEKQWQMRFDYTDQIGHDVIATMMDCDVISINHGTINAYPDDYDDVKEYVCLTENYEPEWASRGERNLAQSQIEIVEVPSTIFNQNLT